MRKNLIKKKSHYIDVPVSCADDPILLDGLETVNGGLKDGVGLDAVSAPEGQPGHTSKLIYNNQTI